MLAAQSSAAPFSRFDFYCERLGVDFEQLDEGEKAKLNECFVEGGDYLPAAAEEVAKRGGKAGSQKSKLHSKMRAARFANINKRIHAAQSNNRGAAWLAAEAAAQTAPPPAKRQRVEEVRARARFASRAPSLRPADPRASISSARLFCLCARARRTTMCQWATCATTTTMPRPRRRARSIGRARRG